MQHNRPTGKNGEIKDQHAEINYKANKDLNINPLITNKDKYKIDYFVAGPGEVIS